ncbi:MAG: solute carrier family 23 protein, partial [Anaerovoracaceae bacterium]
ALFSFDFSYVASHVTEFAVIVFSFLFMDLFDTVGTLIGVAKKGNLLDENGNLPRAGRALMADAVGTVAGACLGTSTVTSYVESSAGVAQGGRTGLTAVFAAALFLLALFFSPIFLAIPGFATTPALIFVGWLMMGSVKEMTFEGDIADVTGGFMAIVMMPFTYSIANGIMFGIITWVILKVLTGKAREIHPVMWVSFGVFALRIITLVI